MEHLQNSDEKLVVTFLVAGNLCGLEAGHIQEVVKMTEITRVYSAKEHIAGIMNLRGKIVCVLDLAAQLGLGIQSRNEESRILIIQNKKESIGLIVDAVLDTYYLDEKQHKANPGNMKHFAESVLKGIYANHDEHISVLDLELILANG
jgi:purine-binding chemotaxis protein CheW